MSSHRCSSIGGCPSACSATRSRCSTAARSWSSSERLISSRRITRTVRGMARPRSPKGRAREVLARLADVYPGTPKELCELDHESPFQLLVATILSAQTTDARVNTVTPELFRRWPTPDALAAADITELETVLQPTGFFRQKAKSVQGMARALCERFGGEVPHALEDLVTLPGVGRKTAN